jgi:hypoxanthine phosphoribosyltransferase
MSGAATLQRRAGAIRRRDREGDIAQLADNGRDAVRQEFLPPLRWLLQPDDLRFAHPAEVQFARLLTFYNVRWAYEPTTFAVRWGGDGRAEEFVTPDFFLPDHDLYIELTTMRQRLVTRKNRKFRMLRETYPNVRVRLLYLRDCERLQDAYGPAAGDQKTRIGSTVFGEDDVETRVAELARELVERWHDGRAHEAESRPLLLGLGAGSARFGARLAAHVRDLGIPVDADQTALTAYAAPRAATRVRLARPPAPSVTGRQVVIVQEVLSTGLSAVFLEGWLRRHGAASVGVCALLDRQAARILDVPVVARGFQAPDVALAGYGLARWSEYRDLPFIAAVETSQK